MLKGKYPVNGNQLHQNDMGRTHYNRLHYLQLVFPSQKYITYLVTENSITPDQSGKTERREMRINVFSCHSVTGAVCSSFSSIITYFAYWSLCCGCIAVKKHLQLSAQLSSVTNASSNLSPFHSQISLFSCFLRNS